MQFWSNLEAQLELGLRVLLVLVADNTRHSPGTKGARMFVTERGLQIGTVGGGIMELEILKSAQDRLQSQELPTLDTLHHKQVGPGLKSGMICAGNQTNLMMVLDERHLPAVSDLAALDLEDKPGELLIASDGRFEVHLKSASRPLFSLQRGEGIWEYSERIFHWKRAAIIGGGHCGLALSEVLNRLGYVVTVFDVRDDLQTLGDNLYARYIQVVDDYHDAAQQILYPEFTHVIVMTADFPGDTRALFGVWNSRKEFPFVGVMGSPAKIRKIHQTLRELGVEEDFLERVHGPIGVPMKSNKPEEIAISVAAQLLQLRDELFEEVRWSEAAED